MKIPVRGIGILGTIEVEIDAIWDDSSSLGVIGILDAGGLRIHGVTPPPGWRVPRFRDTDPHPGWVIPASGTGWQHLFSEEILLEWNRGLSQAAAASARAEEMYGKE